MIFERIFAEREFDVLNNTQRWSGWRNNKQESITEHSFMVVWFARMIVEEMFPNDVKKKLDVADYAMFHDFDEIFTGDIPHYVKYDKDHGLEFRDVIDRIATVRTLDFFKNNDDKSEVLMKHNIIHHKDQDVVDIVKIADWLSMLFYIEREISLGNTNVLRVRKYCIEKLLEKLDNTINRIGKDTANVEFLNQIGQWLVNH